MELLELPTELLEHILRPHALLACKDESMPHETIMREIVVLLRLLATCTSIRAVLKPDAAKLLATFGVSSFEALAVALALKAVQMPCGGNRIGFEFASVALAPDTGRGSDVLGSHKRLAVYAQILQRHPRARAVIDAHCGPTAPRAIATQYSVQRGELVVSELAKRGVDRSRLAVAGHGRRVSASDALQESEHPNTGSARRGYGWAEVFVTIDGTELPARPDYYSAASATSHPAAGPSSSIAFNWWRAAPGEEDDSDDDNDEDMQGPGPAVAGGRRSRCVIS